MAILDRLFLFTGGLSGATSTIATSATTATDSPTTGTQTSSNAIDVGSAGLPTSASGGGARDLGIGDNPALKLQVQATGYTSGGTSIQVNLQSAPDNGSGAPGSYTTIWTGPVVLVANISGPLALSTPGQVYLANVDFPRPIPGIAAGRYYQLQFISAGTFAGLTVRGGVVLDRFDQYQTATGAGGVACVTG